MILSFVLNIILTPLCFSDKPYSNLKPGQQRLERDYYQYANGEKPSGSTVLSNFNRFKSNYENHHDENVLKGDYVVPAKSQNQMSKLLLLSN
mgnify:CR=1 FL=1